MSDRVTVVGAGPAGLACAIGLARAGKAVLVREWHGHVGARFHGDFQGLENWSSDEDVLEELNRVGVGSSLEAIPVSAGTAFDERGHPYKLNSAQPLFYLVRRGPEDGSLDCALLECAKALGVEIRFNDRARAADNADILAIGPRTADAIAAGYVFETDMPEGSWLALDDRLAPSGYAYLLVYRGRGTLASCMFGGFQDEARHVTETVAFFREHVALEMRNPKAFGGYGNFRMPLTARQGGRLVAGEQAGFQDPLAGFGMRYALRSGILAAQSLITGQDYSDLWRRNLAPQMKAGAVNRYLFNLCGSRLRRYGLSRLERGDARHGLRRIYRPNLLSDLMFPLARLRFRNALRDPSCQHENCGCVWCRCVAENATTDWRAGV